jgi:hypothetical protein
MCNGARFDVLANLVALVAVLIGVLLVFGTPVQSPRASVEGQCDSGYHNVEALAADLVHAVAHR